jgi:hypothetical protein
MRKLLAGCVLVFVLVAGFITLRATQAETTLFGASQVLERETVRIEVGGGIEGPAFSATISGEGVASPDPYRAEVEFQYETTEGVVEWTAIKTDQDRFLASPQMAKAMPSGKRWLRATDVPGAANVMIPHDYRSFLERAKDVEKLDDSVLRGQRATHYKGVIDSQEAIDDAEAPSKEFAETMISERPITIEAWLDEDDRPLRLAVRVHQTDGAVVNMHVDILEYGVRVDVQEPPAAQVAEQSELKQS